MKHLFLFTCFVIIVSCSESRQARTVFSRAESYMAVAPDSALTLVRGIDGKSLPTKELRARHALLVTMAQDKCYIDVADDSTICVAYDYYQRHGSKKDRLLATYYLGVIRQNAGDYISATLAFGEAEPLAEELEDYRQLSLIERHLSNIYASNYDHIRALEYAEKAARAAEQAGESLLAGYCLYDMAVQLLAEYRYDEAAAILSRVILCGKEKQVLYSRAAKGLAETSLFKKDPDLESVKTIYQDLDQLGVKLNSHDYGVLALICEKENNSQKADAYLKVAEEGLITAIDSLVYYNDCRNVYDCRKDWEKAHRSKTESVKIQDRITINLLGQSITHAMENHYQKNLEIEILRSRSRMIAFGAVGALLSIVIAWLALLLKKKNQQLLEDMATIQEVSDDVNLLRSGNSETSQIINQLVADKIKSLQQLSESYFSWDDVALKKLEAKKGTLFKDEIIASFRMQLNELRSDHTFIASLEQSLNLTDDGIMEKARQCLKNEKELDYSILTLLFSGFSIKSISYLLRMSEASLRMRKTRFKQQFESMTEPLRSLFLARFA